MKSIKDIMQPNYIEDLTGNREQAEPIQEFNQYSHSSIPSNSRSTSKVNCTLCEDRGIIFDGEIARPCTCMRQKRMENLFRHARMARGLLNCRFDTFKQEYYLSQVNPKDRSYLEGALLALNASKEFVDRCLRDIHGLGLMLIGPVGAGKTFLAASIANALMEREQQVLFLVVPDLLDQLRATYKSDDNELDLLDTAREIPILILDDLGAHNYTDWTRNRLYSIINYRLNEQLPTVITSNLTLEEMEEYLGARTTSRLIQSCRIFRMNVEQDIRLRQYQEREKERKK